MVNVSGSYLNRAGLLDIAILFYFSHLIYNGQLYSWNVDQRHVSPENMRKAYKNFKKYQRENALIFYQIPSANSSIKVTYVDHKAYLYMDIVDWTYLITGN